MTGVILFRAQPFHDGHMHMIENGLNYCNNGTIDSLHIFIGSADKYGTERNPLPIAIRMDLIVQSLKRRFSQYNLNLIKVHPLEDLQDESNNTYSWGDYLHGKIKAATGEEEYFFFYSGDENIPNSWFSPEIRSKIHMINLPRHRNITATSVRTAIQNADRDTLISALPLYVYENLDTIRPYILNAEKENKHV